MKKKNLSNYSYRMALNFGYSNKPDDEKEKLISQLSKNDPSYSKKFLPFIDIAIEEGKIYAKNDKKNEKYDIHDFEELYIYPQKRELLPTSFYLSGSFNVKKPTRDSNSSFFGMIGSIFKQRKAIKQKNKK